MLFEVVSWNFLSKFGTRKKDEAYLCLFMSHFNMNTALKLNSNKISLLLILFLWECVAVCVIIDFHHLEKRCYDKHSLVNELIPVKKFFLDSFRVAELGSLSSGAKMAMKIFVKRVFTIFASNASFLRVIANLQN